MTDIIVGSTWLSYIFNIIQRVPTLTFDQKNISVTGDGSKCTIRLIPF